MREGAPSPHDHSDDPIAATITMVNSVRYGYQRPYCTGCGNPLGEEELSMAGEIELHYTVVVTVKNGKAIEAHMDDADSGYFHEGSAWDPETEQWFEPSSELDLIGFEALEVGIREESK